MEDYCDKKIKIRTVQNIALSEDVFYPSGWRCQTTVEAPPDHVIWFNFHFFDVGRPSVIYCTDVLRIYDGKTTADFDIEFAVIYNKRSTSSWMLIPNELVQKEGFFTPVFAYLLLYFKTQDVIKLQH